VYHYDEPTLDFNGMASEAHNWAVQTLSGYLDGSNGLLHSNGNQCPQDKVDSDGLAYDCWELCTLSTLKAVSPILYNLYNDPQWGLLPMSGSAKDLEIAARLLGGNYTPPAKSSAAGKQNF
jgi:hypothetical protein